MSEKEIEAGAETEASNKDAGQQENTETGQETAARRLREMGMMDDEKPAAAASGNSTASAPAAAKKPHAMYMLAVAGLVAVVAVSFWKRYADNNDAEAVAQPELQGRQQLAARAPYPPQTVPDWRRPRGAWQQQPDHLPPPPGYYRAPGQSAGNPYNGNRPDRFDRRDWNNNINPYAYSQVPPGAAGIPQGNPTNRPPAMPREQRAPQNWPQPAWRYNNNRYWNPGAPPNQAYAQQTPPPSARPDWQQARPYDQPAWQQRPAPPYYYGPAWR